MAFSPDWEDDAGGVTRSEWLAARSEYIGRTAAMHQPWIVEEGGIAVSIHRPKERADAVRGRSSCKRPATATTAFSTASHRQRAAAVELDGGHARSQREAPSSANRSRRTGSSSFVSESRRPARMVGAGCTRAPSSASGQNECIWAGDRGTALAYRSGFAWSQHAFQGEHVKVAEGGDGAWEGSEGGH